MAHTARPSAAPESGEIYRMLAEVLPVAVLIVDTTGTHFYVNELAARMTGYTVEELMGGV